MKKKIYTRPVTVVLSDKMFEHIKSITDQEDMSISDYIRKAVHEKLAQETKET